MRARTALQAGATIAGVAALTAAAVIISAVRSLIGRPLDFEWYDDDDEYLETAAYWADMFDTHGAEE